MKVELYSLDDDANDRLVGTITLEGNSLSGDTKLAKHVLNSEVWLEDGRTVTAEDDARLFCENLHRHYKSYALRATKPKR